MTEYSPFIFAPHNMKLTYRDGSPASITDVTTILFFVRDNTIALSGAKGTMLYKMGSGNHDDKFLFDHTRNNEDAIVTLFTFITGYSFYRRIDENTTLVVYECEDVIPKHFLVPAPK